MQSLQTDLPLAQASERACMGEKLSEGRVRTTSLGRSASIMRWISGLSARDDQLSRESRMSQAGLA